VRAAISGAALTGAHGTLDETEFWLQALFVTGTRRRRRWLAGRLCAHLAPLLQVIAYSILLGAVVRFFHFALFEADLFSPASFLADTLFLTAVGYLSWRIARTTLMVTQYRWLYERSSPVTWRKRLVGKE
jgi:hypothetical protein